MADFQLIETMRIDEGCGVLLLERHLERLRKSADFFSFRFEAEAIHAAVAREAGQINGPACLRLTLAEDGGFEIEIRPLPADRPLHVRISPLRVDSANPFLYHKTTRRELYEQARRGCDERTEALLANERGEITETTITNVAVFRSGRWTTPPVSSGLLAGVMRAELLSGGTMVEGVVRADELSAGEMIRCFNALRGVFDVPLA